MDNIAWLQDWYTRQCDADWEHSEGIRIYTLDNPGWRVRVSLIDTSLDGRAMSRYKVERSATDWLQCWVADGYFEAACGPMNLDEALGNFRKWAADGETAAPSSERS